VTSQSLGRNSGISIWWNGTKGHLLLIGTGIGSLLVTNVSEVLLPKFIQWTTDLIAGNGSKIPGFAQQSQPVDSLARLVWGFLAISFAGGIGRVVWRETCRP
jgi:hypothetical protein